MARRLDRFAVSTIIAASLFTVPVIGHAENREPERWDRFYLGAGYAVSYAPDDTLHIKRNANGGRGNAQLDYDLGFRAGSLSAGYVFADHWRAELEAGYRRNELEVIEFSDERGLLNTGIDDAVDTVTGFANLYYNFAPHHAIQPYLGAGVGFARTRYQTSFGVPGFDFKDNTPLFAERDSTFAWQLIAGAGIELTKRTRLSAEYRYWQTGEISFSAENAQIGVQETYTTRHKLHMAGLNLHYFPGATCYQQRRADTASTPANAKPPGRYLEVRLGAIAAEDSDLDFPTSDQSVDNNFDAFDLGPVASIALGSSIPSWRPRWPLRVELEATRFSNEADLVDFGRLVGEYRLKGDATVNALAVNLLIDRPGSGRRLRVTPYAGLGVGYASIDYDIFVRGNTAGPGGTEPGVRARQDAAPGNPPGEGPNPTTRFMDDRDNGVMIQALLGVSVQLSRYLDASLSYRYWSLPNLEITSPDGVVQKTQHSAHAFVLGVRFRGLGRWF